MACWAQTNLKLKRLSAFVIYLEKSSMYAIFWRRNKRLSCGPEKRGVSC